MTTPTIRFDLMKKRIAEDSFNYYVLLNVTNGSGIHNRTRVSTGIRVSDINNWKQNTGKIKVTSAEPNAKIYNDKLYRLKAHFITEFESCLRNNFIIDRNKVKEINKSFGNVSSNKKKRLESSQFDLITIWENYVEGMKKGMYVNKKSNGKPYSKNTIQNHLGSLNHWREFENKKGKILTHQINSNLWTEFVYYWRNHEANYLDSAINKWIVCFKALMNKEIVKKYKSQLIDYNSTEWIEIGNESLSWALTDEELETLYNIDLKNNQDWDLHRDVFVFNAYTCGMRIGDYMQLEEKKIKIVKDRFGNEFEVIEFKQQKTGGRVVVPLGNIALDIIEKYGEIPMPESPQRCNEVLKIVGKRAKLNKKISKTLNNGRVLEAKQWEILTNHVARKTFCTLTYKAGLSTLDIMNISGHKSERVLLGYINVTEEEHALRFAQSNYFKKINKIKRKHLKVVN